MPTTANRGYPTPAGTVAPNGPLAFTELADAIDADVQSVADDLAPLLDRTWTALTLGAGWSAYSAGGGFYNGLRARDVGPAIQINGMIKGGVVGTIATLPPELRPSHSVILPAMTTGATAIIKVSNLGAITYEPGSPSTPDYLALNITVPK